MNASRTASSRSARLPGAVLLLAALTLPLAACGGGDSAPASSTPESKPTAAASATPEATAEPAGDAVAGYAPGEIPPIPLLVLPSLALLDSSLGGFSIKVADDIPSVPGITVTPAPCGDAIVRSKANGSLVLNGDGSAVKAEGDDSVINNGDGSGVYELNGVSVIVNGDGSGVYADDETSIVNNGDGSGAYDDGTLQVVANGDGSGTWANSDTGESLVNNGDGSGTYTDGTVSIVNNGDGSGTYSGPGIDIVNSGDGTAIVNGTQIDAEPVAPAPLAGSFPPMGSIAPIEYCGTLITLQDGVLFDFDKADVRPDASGTLDALADLMNELGVPAAEVGGHTDAIGSDSYNQDLSERRAEAVVAALTERKVTATLDAVGYGETAPVAANEINGADNPAGRQLNRRVEIFIPAF